MAQSVLATAADQRCQRLRSKATNADPWVIGLRRRRPSLVVAAALANKTARIAWAVMTSRFIGTLIPFE
jgi:hypothetical protein